MVFYVCLFIWVFVEVAQRVYETVAGKGRMGHDKGTRFAIALSLGLPIGISAGVLQHRYAGSLPAGARVAGTIVLGIGLILRVWAIVSLRGSFRTTVEVDPDQRVISDGPYRWLRHPSYTGMIIITLGTGLGFRHWLSVVLCTIVPLPALLWRIEVEEAELTRVLGDAYREYAAHTKRIIPGVW